MSKFRKPKIIVGTKVKRVDQKHFDSRKLGPCDAFFKLVHDTNVNKFKATTTMEGKKKTSVEGQFKHSRSGKGKHLHTFGVRRHAGGETTLFGASPRTKALPRGTVVTWHNKSADPAVMIVTGTAEGKTFSNQKMKHHEGYSHIFLEPGTYRYHNGKTGAKRKRGEVKVKKVPRPGYILEDGMVEPVLVECRADGFHPQKVEVVVGQPVGWLVFEKDSAIIGDSR